MGQRHGVNDRDREMNRETDGTIRQIEFELEKAEHGMGLPYDAERVGQLRKTSRGTQAETVRRVEGETGSRRGLGTVLIAQNGEAIFRQLPR